MSGNNESGKDVASRRIMRQIGTSNYIPILNIRSADLWLIIYTTIATGVFFGFIGSALSVDDLLLVGTVVGVILGAATVIANPTERRAWAWVKTAIASLLTPNIVYAASATSERTARNEGGAMNYTPFKPDERTQDWVGVTRVLAGAGAAVRKDGKMEAFVELVPDNMDFATDDEWRARQRIAHQFVNNNLVGDLKFYATTRSFDLDAYIDRLRDRLNDDDVRHRPVIRELAHEYTERRPVEIRSQGLQQVRYYIGLTVRPTDVQDARSEEPTPKEKLSRVPVLGALFTPFVERTAALPQSEREQKMVEELEARIEAFRSQYVSKMPGLYARRLSSVEMLALNARYFNHGDDPTYDTIEQVMGGGPAMRSRPRPPSGYENEPATDGVANDARAQIRQAGVDTGEPEESTGATEYTPGNDFEMHKYEYDTENSANNGETDQHRAGVSLGLLGGVSAAITHGKQVAGSFVPPTPAAISGRRLPVNLPPEIYNALFEWQQNAETVTEPTAIPLRGLVPYVLLVVIVGYLLKKLAKSLTTSSDEVATVSVSRLMESQRRHGDAGGSLGETGPDAKRVGEGRTVQDISEKQNAIMAPHSIERDTRSPRLGEQYVKTLYLSETPGPDGIPYDGFLCKLFETTDVEFDVAAHVHPKHQPTARNSLRDHADNLSLDADDEQSSRAGYLAKRAAQARATQNAAEGGTRVFDLGLYITVRADTRDELQEAAERVRDVLTDYPANAKPKTLIGRQDKAVQTVAPLGPDELAYTDRKHYHHVAMAGGVAAMLVSPTHPTLFEENGIEMGVHKNTQTPLIIDPFARENGYAQFIIAMQGSGKSYKGKVALTRLLRDRDDVRGVVLEPMGNWAGVAEAMQASTDDSITAEHIIIGGDTKLNPLEIKPVTPEDAKAIGRDYDPRADKIDTALSMLRNYLSMRGYPQEVIAKRSVRLENAIEDAFSAAGIKDASDVILPAEEEPTWDPPTMTDVLDALEARATNPEQYVTRTEGEAERIKEHAEWLLDQLGPFENGRYQNLGGQSEFDIGDADLIYLDLGQAEGNMSDKDAFVMQLLITKVYEEAKETDDKVVFPMDEFRYILQTATSLDFMGMLFRHHRHYEISPWIITQTVKEFLRHEDPEADAILRSCTVKQFHRLEEMNAEIANEFGLNAAQARFVAEEAEPGSEGEAFSDCLIGVDGEWRKTEFRALPGEHRVAEYDPRKHRPIALPGITEQNAHLVRGQSGPTQYGTPSEKQSRGNGHGENTKAVSADVTAEAAPRDKPSTSTPEQPHRESIVEEQTTPAERTADTSEDQPDIREREPAASEQPSEPVSDAGHGNGEGSYGSSSDAETAEQEPTEPVANADEPNDTGGGKDSDPDFSAFAGDDPSRDFPEEPTEDGENE